MPEHPLLLIFRPEHRDKLELFAHVPGLDKVLDRRQRDRRHQAKDRIAIERRHAERRLRPWAELALEAQGFVVVRT